MVDVRSWLFSVLAGLLFSFLALGGLEAAGQSYEWDNVAIGGGGYMTGLKIHPRNPSLIYVRTDVGGVYRWDPGPKRLEPLFNWVPPERSNLYGINGIALDPSDQDVVFVAAGKYDEEGAGDNHGVYLSENQGRTWEHVGTPGRFEANGGEDRFGKPLAINPHRTGELWVGTKGNGLHLYDRSAQKWSKADDIPEDAWIQTVAFDATDVNLIYVATPDDGVFRSLDSGTTFERVPGSPSGVTDMDLSRDGEQLFASTGQGLFRLHGPATGNEWRDVTPGDGQEFRTVTTSPHDPEVLVTAVSEYGGLDQVFVSKDGGNHWTQKSEYRVDRHIPWHPKSYPGSAISQFAFDPAAPGRVYFTDWYSFWKTDNLFSRVPTWTNEMGLGHEEVVSLALSSPPANSEGVILYSGHADVSGLRHTHLDSFPKARMRDNVSGDLIREVTGFDYCPCDPNFVVVTGSRQWEGQKGGVYISDDAGETLERATGYRTSWGWSRPAVSVDDKANIVLATRNGGVVYSENRGEAFRKAEGSPSSAHLGLRKNVFSYRHILTADGEAPSTFYLYSGEQAAVYRSRDGGATWSKTFDALPSTDFSYSKLRSAWGRSGHLWLALGEKGLWRSTDGGDHFARVDEIRDGHMVALGKARAAGSYPAVYLYGTRKGDDDQWIYRSDDAGQNWLRINDAGHRVGNSPQVMAADRQVYGRVYVGTNGSGVWYGQPRSESATQRE